MKYPIEILQSALNRCDGYILIPEKYRKEFCLSDGGDDTKTTKIKSIVNVCELFDDSPKDDIITIKMIDEDDQMWDAENHLKDLVKICGKIDSNLVK